MGTTNKLFHTVTDVQIDRSVLIKRSYGVIEVHDQKLKAIHLRPYPKLVSIAEINWTNFWKKSATTGDADRVLLYYNQPMLHRKFLALKYFVSDYKASLASVAVCLSVLDFIAKLKNTDAIVTEITNKRIKDSYLNHFGWEQHLLNSRKRHWIKRFYGEYPNSFLFQKAETSSSTSTNATSQSKTDVHPRSPIILPPISPGASSPSQFVDS